MRIPQMVLNLVGLITIQEMYHRYIFEILLNNYLTNEINFYFKQNQKKNDKKVLNSRITSIGLVSTMMYLSQTDVELVTLACWASNPVGRQQSPCLIHILPASKFKIKICVKQEIIWYLK